MEKVEPMTDRNRRLLELVDIALFGTDKLGYEPNRAVAIESRERLRKAITEERDELRNELATVKQARDMAVEREQSARAENNRLREELRRIRDRFVEAP